MNDDQRKHLEFIQAVITRMGGNSFLLRGWSVTLVSALFALAAKDTRWTFVLISFFPCAMFWCLDAYYLSQERKFRSLYDHVRATNKADYDMNTAKAAVWSNGWVSAFFSLTILIFHGSIIAVIAVVALLLQK